MGEVIGRTCGTLKAKPVTPEEKVVTINKSMDTRTPKLHISETRSSEAAEPSFRVKTRLDLSFAEDDSRGAWLPQARPSYSEN